MKALIAWDSGEGVTHDLRVGRFIGEKGAYSAIDAGGSLMRYTSGEAAEVVREWKDALAPGGALRVSVVDLVQVVKSTDAVDLADAVYGDGKHKSIWNAAGIVSLLNRTGFVNVIQSATGHAAVFVAYKPTATLATGLGGQVVGVMSCPRLGFTHNSNTMSKIGYDTGIEIHRHTGVFWGQGLTQGIEAAIKSGAKWILTLDYDTVAEGYHVRELIRIAETSGVDALAAFQMRREAVEALANVEQSDWGRLVAGEHCVPAKSAHFGLTLLRASAFDKLSKPWFIAKPAPDGTWNDGKVDEDIVFWQQWAAAGNTLGVSGSVCIGHIEAVVSMVGHGMQKVYVPLSQIETLPQKGRY